MDKIDNIFHPPAAAPKEEEHHIQHIDFLGTEDN